MEDFDYPLLLELFDGETETVIDVLKGARLSIIDDVTRIIDAVAGNDGSAIIEAAHHLKGTCGTLRAQRCLNISAVIERIPKSTPWEVATDQLRELQTAADSLEDAIGKHTREN